jgi:serine/threonine-protein kinase
MIGKVFGNRYELLEKAGVGGMAVVYKAKCHLLNRFVAVKVLKEELVSDEEFLRKFSREAQSAASLSHHNIVNVYDVGKEDGIPYIVMEYVEGVTLKSYIDSYEGFLKNEEIANFARQIALALEHAHGNQIIHRDIKPHNIMVNKDGTLKVADFGIASAISETTTSYSSEAIGSVKYSSPEQARGRNVDERTDLYSLGVLMYEMATRKVPFQGETAVEIALKHMKEDIVPPSAVNSTFHKGIESIVMRSLLKDIGQRYQTARELIDDLEKIINNPSVNVAFYDFESDAPTQKIPSLEEYDTLDEGDKRTMKKVTNNTMKAKTNRNILGVVAVILLGFLTAFIIFVFTRLGAERAGDGPDFVFLDDVVGMTYEAAKGQLEEGGFIVIDGESEYNNMIATGLVSKQSPPANTKLRPGFKITLHESLGATMAKVPSLVNKTLTDAEVLVDNTEFSIGDITYVNDDLDKGYILSQTPSAGVDAKDDAMIDLVVSLGPEYNLMIVPRLTDLTLEEAQKRLIELSLVVGELTYENHPTIEKDRVITQGISEGTEVELDSTVDLVISLGNEEDEEDLEEKDPNAITTKAYNIPASDYIGQSIIIKVTYEKSGATSVVYNQTHVITEEAPAVLIEVSASGEGVLYFFINDEIISSRAVDFSQ